jgi:5-methylcytosine-specific restriction protein A
MATLRVNWSRTEVILACNLLRENQWRWMSPQDPRAIELSDLLRRSPEHPLAVRSETFRNPNGVVRKMQDLQSRLPDYRGVPTHGSQVDIQVLHDFVTRPIEMIALAQRAREAIESDSVSPALVAEVSADPDLGGFEGTVVLASHLRRERDPRLRREKIRRALRDGSGLGCEACGFDFESVYGDLGQGYIEVHHVVPLHVSGATRTKLPDLALVCSNCHRMIHRGRHWLTPNQLRETIASRRQTD